MTKFLITATVRPAQPGGDAEHLVGVVEAEGLEGTHKAAVQWARLAVSETVIDCDRDVVLGQVVPIGSRLAWASIVPKGGDAHLEDSDGYVWWLSEEDPTQLIGYAPTHADPPHGAGFEPVRIYRAGELSVRRLDVTALTHADGAPCPNGVECIRHGHYLPDGFAAGTRGQS